MAGLAALAGLIVLGWLVVLWRGSLSRRSRAARMSVSRSIALGGDGPPERRSVRAAPMPAPALDQLIAELKRHGPPSGIVGELPDIDALLGEAPVAPPAAPVPSPPKRLNRVRLTPAAGTATITRVIDANLLADRFEPGAIATLTVSLRAPASTPTGRWQGEASLAAGVAVRVVVEASGFTLLSPPPAPFVPPDEGDAPPVAFELRIDAAATRWLHIVLLQDGFVAAELAIDDFATIGGGMGMPHQAPVRPVAEADLMLIVRAGEGRIEASSPSVVAGLDHVPLPGFTLPEQPFRAILAKRLRELYDERADPAKTARELQLVGVELARCLPPDLIGLLRRADIRSVMFRHEDDFDFPIELCYLDNATDPFFVGDRIAVCRWYLGVANPPDLTSKQVGRVAFLRGRDASTAADEALLGRLYPGRVTNFANPGDVIDGVFKSRDFDIIHFTGHCRQEDGAEGGLEMADGTFLRQIDIGQVKAETAFAAARPFVLLNACASAQPYIGLVDRGSFAHRFIASRACAVIGTMWPVAGAVANEFAAAFYAALASEPVGRAFVAAKLSLVREVAGEGDRLSGVARQVAARSYCLFANPDLRLLAATGVSPG